MLPWQAVTKRAGRKKDSNTATTASSARGGQQQVQKAVFESTKKKEVGVSDLTLLSKISNEAINDNLKKRFENGEIYVCGRRHCSAYMLVEALTAVTDVYWPCSGLSQPFQRLYVHLQHPAERVW